MRKVLEVLQDSTIVSKSNKNNLSRFWQLYRQVAEEHDSDFLGRYSEDMGSILLFVGLACLSSIHFVTDVFSVWSFLHCQLVFHCRNGVQSQSRPQRYHECPSHPTRADRTPQPHCSRVHPCRPGIYVVANCISCEDPNDRIRKLVLELASSIRGCTRQAVDRVLQVEEIRSRLAGGTREAQTRDVRRPRHLVFRRCRTVLSCPASDLPSSL
jgi:hypothetical protein